MEPILDQVRQELADIHDDPLALPTDDFAASTGGGAVWGEFSIVINKAIDTPIGTDEIESRLKKILGQLYSSS